MPTITVTNEPSSDKTINVSIQGPRGPKGDKGDIGEGAVSQLVDIQDVNGDDISDNDILKYNSSTQKWDTVSLIEAGVLDTSSSQSISGTKTFLSDIDMNENAIKNIADPVDDQDAVSLAYFISNALRSDTTGIPGAITINNIVQIYQSDYDVLESLDPNTYYIILPDAAADLPSNTVAPVMSGTGEVGNTLTWTDGTWTGSPSFTYNVQRAGVDILGATTEPYTITEDDEGFVLRVKVVGTNGSGAISAFSNTVTVRVRQAPVNTVAPTISGTAEQGQLLSVTSNGTWTGDPTITYTYQWQRDGSNISGATSSTYTTTFDDEGTDVRVRVTGTNSIGNSSAFSSALSIALSGDTGEPPVTVALTALNGMVTLWDGQSGISGTTWANQIISPADGSAQTAYNVTLSNASLFDSQLMVADNVNYITGTNTNFLKGLHKTGNSWTAAFFFKTPDGSQTIDTLFGTASTTGNYGIKIRGDSSGVLKLDHYAGGSAVTKQMTAVTNRGFSAGDSGWTKGAGWTIPGTTTADAVNANTAISQTLPHKLTEGTRYRVTYSITSYSGGSVTVSLGGTAGTTRTATGTSITEDIVAGSGQTIAFTGSNFTGSIDNVDVRLSPNEYYLVVVARDSATDTVKMALGLDTFESIAAGWASTTTDPTYDFNLMSDGNNLNIMDDTASLLGCFFIDHCVDADELTLLQNSCYDHFIPPAATIPDDPTNVVVTAGNAAIYINYDIASDGKSSLTDTDIRYRVSGSGTWTNYTHTATGIYRTVAITSGVSNGTAYEVEVRPRNAVGPSTNWTTTQTVTPQSHSADPYDETLWKVTLPTNTTGWRVKGDQGSAYEILPADIGTFNDPFFCRRNGAFEFACVYGNTTGSAKYSRCELRHMTNISGGLGGVTGYNIWDEKTIHVYELPAADGVTNTGKTVIHQWHDVNEPWFKIQFYRPSSGSCQIQCITTEYMGGPDINTTLVSTGLDLTTPFKSKAVLTNMGIETVNTDPNYYNKTKIKMEFYIDDVLKVTKYRYWAPADGTGYFKAGNYFQNNTNDAAICRVRHTQGGGKYTPSA